MFIDGVDVTDSRFGGGSRMPLPATAFTEVRIVASGYGSEYGRAVGGVTETVTRSGTNQFHGDLLYVAQNPSWRAASERRAARTRRPLDLELRDVAGRTHRARPCLVLRGRRRHHHQHGRAARGRRGDRQQPRGGVDHRQARRRRVRTPPRLGHRHRRAQRLAAVHGVHGRARRGGQMPSAAIRS